MSQQIAPLVALIFSELVYYSTRVLCQQPFMPTFIEATTLADRFERESPVLLDVRPSEEYDAGHWPGALSLPVEELAGRLAELPQDRTIVAYCRGPYCVLALHAVEVLRQHGFQAVRMAEGVSDWKAQGLPIEKGSNAS